MAKVGLKDTIKELNQKAGVILTETERVKRNAEIMLQMLQTAGSAVPQAGRRGAAAHPARAAAGDAASADQGLDNAGR